MSLLKIDDGGIVFLPPLTGGRPYFLSDSPPFRIRLLAGLRLF
ncbi:hypothetical protein HMPREF3213_02409 [Heyndrickxia coagulans]|uniref:Uncharacterized protein n=1 Tax=Heyndrickxia coagulans TaxID=1398 RepID=A0A133KJX9_HEYCO|nr:hypothetical protein HMPREF3213_02409 [Heyndrickxia coagulans]